MKDDVIPIPIRSPNPVPPRAHTDAGEAVAALRSLYAEATGFLRDRFREAIAGGTPDARYRAYYPEVRITTTRYGRADSRLSFGHVAEPGRYAATITRPDLFASYLAQQIELLVASHEVPVVVGWSTTPMPIHFAVLGDPELAVPQDGILPFLMRDVFDVPDLGTTNDDIVNGLGFTYEDGTRPLAPFTAPAGRLQPRPPRALHRDRRGPLPEPRPVHELPVLRRRVRGLRARRAARPVVGLRRARRADGPDGDAVRPRRGHHRAREDAANADLPPQAR